MRILFLTKYSALGASSRYRTFQYLPSFRKAGLDCEHAALFDDRYLTQRFGAGKRSLSALVRGFTRRLGSLLRIRRFDLVVIEKELCPYLPGHLERLLLSIAPPFTLDFDDALFHIYDQHERRLVRALLGRKFRPLLRGARLVTVGNEYLAQMCRPHARRVEYLPTVVDAARYPVEAEREDEPFTVGWIGTPVSAHNLRLVSGVLAGFLREVGGRLLLIGAGSQAGPADVPTELVPWSEATEGADLARLNVGIMPLWDRPLERGKSGLKLLQYLACARPVVASPVGANVAIVRQEVGRLAGDENAWRSSLEELHASPPLRAELGQAGRHMVEDEYSLTAWAPRYEAMLREVVR